MKQLVADAIRFFYQDSHDVIYRERCQAPLDVTGVVDASVAEFGVEFDIESGLFWPAYEMQVSFGPYHRGIFEAEFRTTISISKLAKLFHVFHSFTVENQHEERVLPELDGYGNTGFIKKQFNLHEMLRQRLAECGYTELDLADMDEVVPALSFPEGVTIFGRQVSVRYALFHDLRGLCPAD